MALSKFVQIPSAGVSTPSHWVQDTHVAEWQGHGQCGLGRAGFVRLAIQEQASLVPVLCLGEVGALRNLWDWPSLQQWTYKKLGFPIPYLIGGRWGFTPFPSQTGLRFIIGEAIPPPPLTSDGQVCAAHFHLASSSTSIMTLVTKVLLTLSL